MHQSTEVETLQNRQLQSGEKSAINFDQKSTDSSEEQANNIWNSRVNLHDSERQNEGKNTPQTKNIRR